MARPNSPKRDYTEQHKAQLAAQRQQMMHNLAERLSAAVGAIQDSETLQALSAHAGPIPPLQLPQHLAYPLPMPPRDQSRRL